MTPPRPPTANPPRRHPARDADTAPTPDAQAPDPAATTQPDALAGLPPLPKTKPTPAPMPSAGPDARPGSGPDAQPGTAQDDGLDAVTKKELFTRVKARTQGVKGRDVRRVMDALLDELGEALVAGEALKVPALGTLKVQRRKTRPKADVVVCKLHRKKRANRAKDPLAKPAEEG